MAVSAELRAKVLQDYRDNKVGAAALAKKHGLSRSSVYRILAVATEPKTGGKSTAVPEAPKLVVEERSDDGSSVASQVSNSFYRRSDRFADDLGLQTGGRPVIDENERVDPVEREAELDAAMERMLGPTRIGPVGPEPDADLFDRIVAASPPSPQAPAQHSEPTGLIDREDTSQRIVFIVEHFGPLVVGIVGSEPETFLQRLVEKSDLELTRLLRTLERARSVGNIAAGFKQLFFFAGQTTEAVSKLIGLKTDGFTDHLREQDRELTMIMKEIAMNQWERVKALDSPEMRLASMFCLTLLQTDATNRMKAMVRPSASAKVDPNIVAAHADL